MELVFFWILCGIVAAVIASAKGGSGFVGFLAGILLGPFGIIIAFFLGSPRALEAKELAAGAMKKCPRCAELVKPDAQVCRYCSHEFVPTGRM